MNFKKICDAFSLEEKDKFNNKFISDNKTIQSGDAEVNINVQQNVSPIIGQNIRNIKIAFNNCFDITIKEIYMLNFNRGKIVVAYLLGLTTEEIVDKIIISKFPLKKDIDFKDFKTSIISTLGISSENVVKDFNKCIEDILSGNVVVFVDMVEYGFSLNINNPPQRSIEEPNNETVLRGPREGFTESLQKNIGLIRKNIKSRNLKLEKFTVGKDSKKDLAICYISGAADESIVEEVKKRIKSINIKSVLESNYIAECIQDNSISAFPTIYRTEKPDVAASKLLEGKVLIMLEGTPVVLSVPALFVEFMQSADDYYVRSISASLNRGLRYIGIFMTLTLPAIYVALVDFHQELIPTSLAITFINSRSGVPFPAAWECFLMLIFYDIIREAGIRIPKTLGQTVSIVGTLVLGEAAVRAGIVGAPVIIVVGFTGIALFTVPSPELNTSINIIKYVFLFLASILGIIGIIYGMLFILMYLISIRSFGVPYMYPFAPLCIKRNEDTLMRMYIGKLDKLTNLFKK
ncbi:MAG: spore germination protein [Clostridium sp.]|nr:spore germination protein [Clostridium sp.]